VEGISARVRIFARKKWFCGEMRGGRNGHREQNDEDASNFLQIAGWIGANRRQSDASREEKKNALARTRSNSRVEKKSFPPTTTARPRPTLTFLPLWRVQAGVRVGNGQLESSA